MQNLLNFKLKKSSVLIDHLYYIRSRKNNTYWLHKVGYQVNMNDNVTFVLYRGSNYIYVVIIVKYVLANYYFQAIDNFKYILYTRYKHRMVVRYSIITSEAFLKAISISYLNFSVKPIKNEFKMHLTGTANYRGIIVGYLNVL